MMDDLRSDLDQLLPQRRQRPMTNVRWQRQSSEEIAQVVRQGEQLQPDLIGDETAAGESRPFQGVLAFLDPLLSGPTLVVEPDHITGPPSQVRHDEADTRIQFPSMPLDLHHNPPRLGPGRPPGTRNR